MCKRQLQEGRVLETVSHSELMGGPKTDYARKLVDAQRLERRPRDEVDSSAGAPVLSASGFDVVTPDGTVATRNAAFSINPVSYTHLDVYKRQI